MDKKIFAVIAVVIIVVAAVGVYALGNNDKKADDPSNVHAVNLDGVVASEDNVLNGTYSIQRNLILCTLGETVHTASRGTSSSAPSVSPPATPPPSSSGS